MTVDRKRFISKQQAAKFQTSTVGNERSSIQHLHPKPEQELTGILEEPPRSIRVSGTCTDTNNTNLGVEGVDACVLCNRNRHNFTKIRFRGRGPRRNCKAKVRKRSSAVQYIPEGLVRSTGSAFLPDLPLLSVQCSMFLTRSGKVYVSCDINGLYYEDSPGPI